jgi:valyl-tRNA synthetase
VVHPDDPRYAQYADRQTFELEWINGPVTATLIKDPVIDMEFGTGAMTITPWHDAVDFEIAERHGLDKEQIIDEYGKLREVAGDLAGMKIGPAREAVVEKLRAKGLVTRVDEDYVHRTARSSRGGGKIEPQIKEQWFVAVHKPFLLRQSVIDGVPPGSEVTLAQLMEHVVERGLVEIIPEYASKTYFHWIRNLRDWCISRQIWYGHRIPAWYRDGETYVGRTAPEGDGWSQDPDTLDTWFSSGMWTFSTLGWPEETEDLRTYHPTSVLETGTDILFFWVARMILMSTYALGDVPFRTAYLHGLVLDAKGQKMSKSKNNGIDPRDMIELYGADALRRGASSA